MMSQDAQLMAIHALELLKSVPDELRHPVIADHNEDLSAMALLVGITVEALGAEDAAVGTKTMMETAFYFGYLAGLEAAQNQPDPAIWNT